MGTTPTDSLHLRFKKSGSTSQTDNPSISISESRTHIQLPQELITEILLRLPVKSLLKFKRVSKPWLSLISSQQFIRSHFSISSMEGGYLNLQLLFTTKASTMKQCSLYSAFHEAEPSGHVSDIEFPSHVFPKPVVLASWTYTHAFGYDESNDDYKVVLLHRKFAESLLEDTINVYSLRADSWRRVDKFKGFRCTFSPGLCDPGLYANGKIYWPGGGASTPNRRNIFSLDMVSEKHGELQFTDYEAGDYKWKLGVLGGGLCVLCDYEGRKADLWAMNKFGVEESWCKVVSIPYANVNPQMPYHLHRVLCILSTSEIVLANRHGLLVYNSKKKESRKIELDVGISSYLKVAAYVESLVWPDA